MEQAGDDLFQVLLLQVHIAKLRILGSVASFFVSLLSFKNLTTDLQDEKQGLLQKYFQKFENI